jgi:hypothetical protein
MLRVSLIFKALLVLALSISPAQACIHVPIGYDEAVTYDTQEIFMYHDGTNAHMIIKPTIKVGGLFAPKVLGWIIPVQSLPVSYKEAEVQIFGELYDIVKESSVSRQKKMGADSAVPMPGGLILHPKQFVGNYEIQPIELSAESNGDELLKWFNDNGFQTKNKDISYYVSRRYTYLAVKITGLEKPKEELKPLHIIYPSNELSVPLKFDSLSGSFDVNIYFLLKSKLPIEPNYTLKTLGFSRGPIELSQTTGKPGLDALNLGGGFLYPFTTKGINSIFPLNEWDSDPTIKIK